MDLSPDKTLSTRARKRARFPGYDIMRWRGEGRLRYCRNGVLAIKRDANQQLGLSIPWEKVQMVARAYGTVRNWRGHSRGNFAYLKELVLKHNADSEVFQDTAHSSRQAPHDCEARSGAAQKRSQLLRGHIYQGRPNNQRIRAYVIDGTTGT